MTKLLGGSLWSWRPGRRGSHVDDWDEHPITKITSKRVFIRDRTDQQLALDRDYLERHGYAAWPKHHRNNYYTMAGRDAEIAEQAAQVARGRAEMRAALDSMGLFPLLGLHGFFTRSDVLAAYRKRAHDLHPDHGGDGETFRKLTAERDRALSIAV